MGVVILLCAIVVGGSMHRPVDIHWYFLIVASAKIQKIGTRLFYSLAGNKWSVG